MTLRRCLGYLRSYRGRFILSLACAIAQVASSLYIPLVAGRAIDLLLGPGEVDMQSLMIQLGQVLCLALVGLVAQYVLGLLNNSMCYGIARDIRDEAFSKIRRLPFSYLDSHSHGDIVSRVTSDVEQLADGLLIGFSQALTAIMTLAMTVFYLFSLDYIMALVVIILSPLSLLVATFIARRTHHFFADTARRRGEQTAMSDEYITQSMEVFSYGMAGRCQEAFDEVNGKWAAASQKGTFYSSLVNPCTRAVNSIVYAVSALTGSILVIMGRLSVGGLVSALSYATQFTKPFNEITSVITELQNALVCAKRVFSLIDEDELVDEGTGTLEGGAISIDFEHVSFSYSPDKELIKDFSLHVGPGEHVAIVGPTGAGKSTLVNLLMRYYEIDDGRILVNGMDQRDISLESLRQHFGTVLQDNYLMAGSARWNVSMGRPFSDTEVEDACRKAHVHSIIERLSDGYDTLLDDDAGLLSAGERQLLSIARCMIDLPSLLILDEATSSIDTRTERLVQEAFNQMMEGRTSFVVAHRLSTIRRADKILVLRDGAVVEMGRHEELLERGGFYSELYKSQFAFQEQA